jgi:membrane protein
MTTLLTRAAGPPPPRGTLPHEMTNPLRYLDRTQQRWRPLAFPFAVLRKFGDDQAGSLAALIAYYGFFSLFPLLLVLVTLLGVVLRGHSGLRQRILESALVNFPVVGADLQRNAHALSGHTTLGLVVGIGLALWGGLGVVRAMENAMNTVWQVPYRRRPNFWVSVARALVMLALFGAVTILATGAAAVGSAGDVWWRAAIGIALSLALNFALFLLAFRILTTADVSWADVRLGAAVGAVAWTALQALGGFIVARQLEHAGSTYGTFAIVVGLLGWLYIGAQLTLYAAELNVVRARRLWPRSLIQPPLTEADRRQLDLQAKVEERRKGQVVTTRLAPEDLKSREELEEEKKAS